MNTSWLRIFADPAAKRTETTARIALGRRMTAPQEPAATIHFLRSPRTAHSTGQRVFADGGQTHLDKASV